jgi:hypothetical protein
MLSSSVERLQKASDAMIDGSSPTDDGSANRDLFDPLVANGPWLARKDWASGTLYYNAGFDLELWVTGVLGPALLGSFIAFLLALPGQIPDHGVGALVPVLILGPFGIGLTLRAVHLVIRWIKYGGSRLRLETVPIPVGGPFRAELALSRRIKAGERVLFRLQCYRATVHEMRSMSAASDEPTSQDTDYRVIWEDEQTVFADGSDTLRIAFVIPADAPGTSAPNEKFWHSWQLKVEVPGDAKSYHAEFDLPVFKLRPTEAQVQEAKSIAATRESDQEAYTPSPALQGLICPAPDGGTEVTFPPLRAAAHAVAQTVIFLVSLTLFLFTIGQLPVVVLLLWGLGNVLLLAWLLRIWLATEQVVFGNGIVSFTSGLFRIQQTMPLDQVKEIHVVAGAITGRNAIRIRGAGWHRFDVGEGIADQRDAEWLAAQMSRAAGIPPAPAGKRYQPAGEMEIINEFVKDFQAGKIDFGPLGNALVEATRRMKKSN